MIAPADLAHCRAAIRTGSRSFHAASKLLPASVRDPALALYAFCRLADDAVDEDDAKAAAVLSLHERLDRAYAGRPRNAPADRAFAALIADYDLPRALPEALLEGLAWDAEGRRYATISDLRAYSARVASAVGAMMCVLMRVRDRDALARACDLGLAMQLTNIARDVGEDARAGRFFLPADWCAEAGLDPETFLADPRPGPAIAQLTRRLLAEADRFYRRADPGIAVLPARCRPGIFAASCIYEGIGGEIERQGHNSVSRRAVTGRAQKLRWLALSAVQAAMTGFAPRAATLHAAPASETAFLVDAAARSAPSGARSDNLIAILGQLRARDLATRMVEPRRPAPM